MSSLRLDEIAISERSRRELRNIDELAESIRTVGLLNPPAVRRAGEGWVLVAGERRLAAMRKLGWTETTVTVAESIEDELTALYAERDENTQREDFTPAEMVTHSKRIEERERALAKVRQREGQERGRAVRHGLVGADSAHTSQAEPAHERKTRDKVAKAVGSSHDTLKKAKHVVELAENPETPPAVAEVARFAASELAKPNAKVTPAYEQVQEAELQHAEKTLVQAIDERVPGAAAERARKATRARWSRLISSAAEITTMDVEAVASAITDDETAAAKMTLRQITKWFEELDAARRPGLRVVGGNK